MTLFQVESNGTDLLEVNLSRNWSDPKKLLQDFEAPLRKSLQEYTRRIASKIAALESSVNGELRADELDDEREIASIGGMSF